MNMKENVRIRKIHLDTLIQVLIEMYDKGVDYIDIIGEINELQDSIGISFSKEYMNKNMKENFDEIDSKHVKKGDIDVSFSDDNDLNQLI